MFIQNGGLILSIKKYRKLECLMDDETKLCLYCLDVEKKTGNSAVWNIYNQWFFKVYQPQYERLIKENKRK